MRNLENYKWYVCVRCMTYNHAPYITDAMNGFTKQQTNFPFVCLIVDDASIDGESGVIIKYLESNFDLKNQSIVRYEETDDYKLVFARHNINLNCYFAVFMLKYNHYRKKNKNVYFTEWMEASKYIALCEGDDYWTDPLKLQKQFDVFENRPKVSLCYTYSKSYIQNKKLFSKIVNCVNGPIDFEGMILREPTLTLTSFFSRKMYQRFLDEIQPKEKGWLMGDTPLWLWLSQQGEIVLLEEVTAVYRILEESSSHSKDINYLLRFNKSAMEIRIYFCERYHRKDLIPQIQDVYRRCCMGDTATYRMPKLSIGFFRDINHKQISDYLRLIKYVIKYLIKVLK